MASFKVVGGKELGGEVSVQGAKNEALQIVASSILAGDITIKNIPKILDVLKMIDMLSDAGAKVIWLEKNIVNINTENIESDYFKSEKYFVDAQKTRGALLFMGPLLARFSFAYIPKTGGDKIGARPIDTHTLGFMNMGAVMSADENGFNFLKLEKENIINNTEMLLEDASVTGTANILMLACAGTENLNIYNAACETYISQLCSVLKSFGMSIVGDASNRITISGDISFDKKGSFQNIKKIEHTILPDFIEVASFIALAISTKSEIIIKNAGVKNLGMTLNMFRKLGADFEIMGDDIKVLKKEKYTIQKMYDGSMMKISCEPWPKISPDILSLGIVTAVQCDGVVLFHEKMYEARMFFVDKLIAMGAQIVLCDPHRVVVTGNNWKSKLNARHMTSPDIRAGVSLLIAALGADGESIIDNIEQIDRGYENIELRLASLGANITRIN
jgi:UDP-N-acetylglucosamine 1-carboxyvinyltransferase